MRRIFFMLSIIILVTGCSQMMNTPVKQVEKLLYKYQSYDKQIEEQLNSNIVEFGFNSEEGTAYLKAMKRQYSNITYEVKEDEIDGNVALVEVEIKVYDFAKVLEDTTKDLDITKLNKMIDTKEKKTYQITFYLTRVDEVWSIDGLNDEIKEKLQGLYLN